MTVRKGFMLCPTGRGLAATRRPFGDAHLPVGHSTRTRISSLYQTTQHKNKVSTLSGDLTLQELDFYADRKEGYYAEYPVTIPFREPTYICFDKFQLYQFREIEFRVLPRKTGLVIFVR